ncbi:hypothetical protein ACLM5J_07610 [Nocardioides sp. Bht2]|uniref:hypothetical protein n=1 Tax=Nocardioides sp. Bht2 TaxID=3392297 RepID=UPI0039B5EE7A
MSGLRLFPQPDARSCGAAAMVTARRLLDADYAAQVETADAFARAALGLHAQLTSMLGPDGRPQVPWPRALGTPPWALARYLRHLTGRRYRTRLALRRGIGGFEEALRAVGPDSPVALYVGSRWLPRHVVLVVGRADDALVVYEPSAGRLRTVHRGPWRWHRLGLAGWRRGWFVVRPDDVSQRQT